MYNFSVPAVVKAYFDSIMQKNETWTVGKHGYIGLMRGKKALVSMASGGEYHGDAACFEHTEFAGMGFDDVRAVTAAGVNKHRDRAMGIVHRAQEAVRDLASEWSRQPPAEEVQMGRQRITT